MDPRAIQNFVEAFSAFKLALDSSPPPAEGPISVNDGPTTMFMRDGIMLILKGDALLTYKAFLEKWNREPWATRWSWSYREDKVQASVVAALKGEAAWHSIFGELADHFDTSPEKFTVWIPLGGIELRAADLAVGRTKLIRFTTEFTEALLSDVMRIIDGTSDTNEQKEAFLEAVTSTIRALEGRTCAEITTEGDSARSKELAEESCATLVDVLQFLAATFVQADRKVRIEFSSFEAAGFRSTIAISEDKKRFIPHQSYFGASGIFIIDDDVRVKIKDCGWDDLLELYSKPVEQLTEIEQFILRAVHWFATAELQRNDENKLQSYVTCLEMFFSSRGGGSTAAVQDGVAFFSGTDFEKRVYFHGFVGKAYDYRSRSSHEGEELEVSTILPELRYLTLQFINEVLRRRSEFETKDQLKAWVAAQRLR